MKTALKVSAVALAALLAAGYTFDEDYLSSAERISSVGPSRWYASLSCSKKARNAG